MGRFLHLLHAGLIAAFAGATADLDAPAFDCRLAASQCLKRHYPLSAPACWRVVRLSESPEAVHRAQAILDAGRREWSR